MVQNSLMLKHPIIHFPTNLGVNEQTNKSVQRSVQAKQAVHAAIYSKGMIKMSEQCE